MAAAATAAAAAAASSPWQRALLALLPRPIVTPLLRAAYARVVGRPLETFHFHAAPLSHGPTVFAAAAGYLATIFIARTAFNALGVGNKLKPAFKWPFFVHNVALSVLSFVLFWGHVENVLPLLLERGVHGAMCDRAGLTKPLEVLYYLNYLTKCVCSFASAGRSVF